MNKLTVMLAVSAAAFATLATAAIAQPAYVKAALADPARPATDVARDMLRKPAEVVVFSKVKPGDTVIELIPGGGYFTRIFAKAVGPNGKVAAASPSIRDMDKAVKAVAAEPAYSNVAVVGFDGPAIAAWPKADVMFTAQNYHDFHLTQAHLDVAAIDHLLFNAVKPGGYLIVEDHVAATGAPVVQTADTLHRIDPAPGPKRAGGGRLRVRRRKRHPAQPGRRSHQAGVRPCRERQDRPVPLSLQEARLSVRSPSRPHGRTGKTEPMKLQLIAAAAVIAAIAAPAIAQAPAAFISAAVADPGRPEKDTKLDASRHPAEIVAFARVKPGDLVMDVFPGGGYWSRIFSKAVGPTGKVVSYVPAEVTGFKSDPMGVAKAMAAEPGRSNVEVASDPLAAPPPATFHDKADVIFTFENYHDFHDTFFKGADVEAFDKAVFQVLKPGGYFIVADHAAPAGSGLKNTEDLHRIDPAAVKAEVEQAGFVFDGETKILANPADPHTAKIFDPAIKGMTDRFVFRFKKPK